MSEATTNPEEHACELCGVTVSSKGHLQQHLQGKRHTLMMSRVSRQQGGDGCTSAVDSCAVAATRQKEYSCELCGVSVQCESHLEQHLKGKRHAAMVSASVSDADKTGDGRGSQTSVRTSTSEDHASQFAGSSTSPQDCPSITDFDSQAFQFMLTHMVPYNLMNAKCVALCNNIDVCLRPACPNGKSTPFGSAVTGLACEQSDIDVYFNPDFYKVINMVFTRGLARNAEQKLVKTARKILGNLFPTFQSVIAIPQAKVALVKFYHMPTKVNCDLSFKNATGVQNSTLIRLYLSLDPRIRPLLMVLKRWGKSHDITGTGHVTSYALVWMTLFYLQQLSEPVVPAVVALRGAGRSKLLIDGWDCSFGCDPSVPPRGTTNRSSICDLLAGFFRFYAHFNQEFLVICPLLGRVLPKTVFYNVGNLPPEMKTLKEKMHSGESGGLKVASRLCVQDPFVLDFNMTVSVGTKLMEKFRHCCLVAGRICSSGQQLHALFEVSKTVNPPVKESCREVVIYHSKLFADKLAEEPAQSSVEDLRLAWYSAVYQTVVDVFENVLQFDECSVTLDGGGSAAKVRKLDSHSDVSDSLCSSEGDFSRVQTLKFNVFFCIWEKYKEFYKDYNFQKANFNLENNVRKSSAIEHQKAVARFAMENFSKYFGKKQCKNETPMFSFMCQFIPEENPVHVRLKFSCETRTLQFVSMLVFLRKNLGKWIQES